jgi:hypothetical protein
MERSLGSKPNRYGRGADLGLDTKRARRLQPGPNLEIVWIRAYLRKRFLEAAISPTKAIPKSEIVGPLSGALTGGGCPNINGMDEIDNKSDRSILDFMI